MESEKSVLIAWHDQDDMIVCQKNPIKKQLQKNYKYDCDSLTSQH